MRLTGSRVYYRTTPPKMPLGLAELIEGLTREVLKHNPTDIYGFCAGHVQQLLEIRDGPVQKKTRTLEEKIAKAQEKVRQRAEQRRQQYNNDLLNQQSGRASEVKATSIIKDTPPILPQNPTPVHDLQKPTQLEHDLGNLSEAELSHELCTPSEDSVKIGIDQGIKGEIVQDDEAVKEDGAVKYDEAVKGDEAVKEDGAVKYDEAVKGDEAVKEDGAVKYDEAVKGDEAVKEDGAVKYDEAVKDDGAVKYDQAVKDDEAAKDDEAVKDDKDLKNDIKSETNFKEYESKNNINLAVTPNKMTESTLTQGSTLDEFPKIETVATKVEMLDNFLAPIDEQMLHDGTQSFQQDQELVAEAAVLQEFDTSSNSSSAPVLSSPINSINTKQGSGPVDTPEKTITNVLSESENADDLDGQNSMTQAVKVISNDFAETQSDHVNNALNKTDTRSNNIEKIQHFIDTDTKNRSDIIDTVVLTSNSDDTVNGNDENSQEINTFDISFQEPPTVDLQDSQINPDMLESLESNTDSDIARLITKESTNDGLKQHNAFERDTANAELHKDHSETNGVSPSPEEHLENTQHQNHTNSIDLMESNNRKNIDIDDSDHEYTSKKLSETPQVHNPDGNMDLETAAVTIQKVFRTFLFKSRASTFDDTVNDETVYLNEVERNKEECNFPSAGSLNERRPHGLIRMDTVLQTVNEEKSLSLSTDDSSTMSSAATVIQAHVRGFLVRNKLHSNKTVSTNSLAASNSNEPSLTSLEMDNEQTKNKTVLNIHIVPEGGNYLSRDESLITSMDLSLDSSPPSSINLHPLGYDKSERRKQLKREDAIQSVSPPSNNSGKLSEDVDSVKELPLNDHEITEEHQAENNVVKGDLNETTKEEVQGENVALVTIASDTEAAMKQEGSGEKNNSDEMDVVTPFVSNEDNNSSEQKLMHSGEFHDAVLPTKVSRSDTPIASEFKNVLVYFLLWNHS